MSNNFFVKLSAPNAGENYNLVGNGERLSLIGRGRGSNLFRNWLGKDAKDKELYAAATLIAKFTADQTQYKGLENQLYTNLEVMKKRMITNASPEVRPHIRFHMDNALSNVKPGSIWIPRMIAVAALCFSVAALS